MGYLIDSDVFIEAKDRHYGFDFCPAFWDWILAGNLAGQVFSVEKVADEIAAGDDELSAWAKEHAALFLKPGPDDMPALGGVSEWARGQAYDPVAVNVFFEKADYYLIAQALAHNHIVVTHERPDSSPKRIKIPNACIGLGVKCMTPFQMLRTERARFVLAPPP